MLRSRHTVPLLILTLIIGGATVAVALAIDWIPVQAAEQAERVDTLLWFVVWASVVIFTLVTVVIVYCAWRFRAKPGDDSDGPPIHGNTKLEIVWTIVPAVLLGVMAVWAYLVLSDNEALASDRMVVEVTAEQFTWEFVNREAGIASGDMRVPAGRQVELEMRSQDVIHDFYVKEFRVKQDVVPGITTTADLQPRPPRHLPGGLRRAVRRRARAHAGPRDRDGARRLRGLGRAGAGPGGQAAAARPGAGRRRRGARHDRPRPGRARPRPAVTP